MRPLLLSLLLFLCLLQPGSAIPRDHKPLALGEVAVAELPKEARETMELIKRGGPFPYRKDGSIFGNFEQLLPHQRRGYYREYTVPTPGMRERGTRRIVAGKGSTGNVQTSGEYYYTENHYRSFRKVRE